MSGFQQFGFGEDDKNIGRKGKRFKMEKGEEARISFAWWPGIENGKPDLKAITPKFSRGPRHYLKGVGYFINKGPEYTKIAGEAPKYRINTLIVKWPSVKGKLDVEAISRGEFEILYWVFDDGKYDEIKPIHGEWHLGGHDLKIKCTEAGFQKMSFSPTKDSILARLAEKPDSAIWQNLVQQVQEMIPGVNDEIGKDMTLDVIREKLAGGGGGGGGGFSGGGGGGGGFSGGGGGGVSGATSDDMDEALDKFLED